MVIEPQIFSRKSLSKKLKTMVWDTYIGKLSRQGNCYSCNYIIDLTNFDCGHVIAVKNGGKDIIENLRPVCRGCNLSCSSKNLNEFKTSLLT
jgi:5-methylcytosine-specific restriction endonuclease McrA